MRTGGLSSAVGEMGEETGAHVNLEKVPLKYAGLTYTEIWISEAQERMVLAVPPENIDTLMKLFANEDVEAAVIGEFTDNKRLQLDYEGLMVCDLDMSFLHKGIPQVEAEACAPARFDEPDITVVDLEAELKKILVPGIPAVKRVIRQYDTKSKGGSVIKPWWQTNDGPAMLPVPAVLSSDRSNYQCINTRYEILIPTGWRASA